MSETVKCWACCRDVVATDGVLPYHDKAPPLRGLCMASKEKANPGKTFRGIAARIDKAYRLALAKQRGE